MQRNLTHALESWIANGCRAIGQIRITLLPGGGYELRHSEDAERSDLAQYTSASDARTLSFFDDANAYRSLKTAPTLRHGWSLTVPDAEALRHALDYFYPAMTALWLSYLTGELRLVPLRETLQRQTGMYAVAKRLQDQEGQELVGWHCDLGRCLKRTLWNFAPDQPLTHLAPEARTLPPDATAPGFSEIPLICQEACNHLVPACRETVKKRERSAEKTASEPA
ncbi:MAG: hypothetical protein EBS01_00430 [Verrucomicrobia bacterium]|nr:hypothetical protein [Verrucomicrobiota bacterium]